MMRFRCDRYPTLIVGDLGVRFDGGVLDTDDPRVIAALKAAPDVRVDDGSADERVEHVDLGVDVAPAEPRRYAHPRSRGWYDVDGEDRKYRRDEIEAEFPDVVILDDEGDRE